MSSASRSDQPFTVYYDGACPLCSKEIDTYRKARGADSLCWIDAASSDADVLGEDLDSATALARMHVRDESGKLISGAAAFAAIWARLPKTRWLGQLMGTRPALWILEPAYRLFLANSPAMEKVERSVDPAIRAGPWFIASRGVIPDVDVKFGVVRGPATNTQQPAPADPQPSSTAPST